MRKCWRYSFYRTRQSYPASHTPFCSLCLCIFVLQATISSHLLYGISHEHQILSLLLWLCTLINSLQIISALHFERDALGVLFQLILSAFQQSHEGEGEEEPRAFLGWMVSVQRTEYFCVSLGLSWRLHTEQSWRERLRSFKEKCLGANFTNSGVGGQFWTKTAWGSLQEGLMDFHFTPVQSCPNETVLSSVSTQFFSASLLTQPSKFLYLLIQVVEGLDWLSWSLFSSQPMSQLLLGHPGSSPIRCHWERLGHICGTSGG